MIKQRIGGRGLSGFAPAGRFGKDFWNTNDRTEGSNQVNVRLYSLQTTDSVAYRRLCKIQTPC